MAQVLLYHDTIHKINFLCLNIWDSKYKCRSPGLYTFATIIKESYEMDYKFSGCYGAQEYKMKLLKCFL